MNTAPVAPLAASLPRIDALDALRSRVLFCEPLARVLGTWVPGLRLAPAYTALPAPEGEAASRFGVLLRGRCAELWLLLPTSVDAVSAAILAAGAWSPTVQMSCVYARAKSALGDLIQYFGTLGLQPVRLEARPEPLVVSDGATMFECRVGVHHIEGCLRCTDGAWLTQLESVITRLPLAHGGPAAGLVLPLRARLGTRRLALSLLRSLEVGDVVLLDGPGAGHSQAGRGLAVVGSLKGRGAVTRACTFRGNAITITGDHWMNTDTLLPTAPSAHDAPSRAAEPGSGADPIADIEIDLHFELQVISTPLAELAAMRPGYVIELPMPAAEATVSLVAGGQVYGRAQLVSIGDRLGARILELFHADR
jgi:type III secretion protein Q